MTRTVAQLLARPLTPEMRPVFVFGSTPAYYSDGTETPAEEVALHDCAVALHANGERREQLQAESERLATLPPPLHWFEERFARLHERLDGIEAALGIRGTT